ncbi:MAG: hypothetical protein V7638_3812 [Acidobacteriota bacterium]|jgi:hypothetical protein
MAEIAIAALIGAAIAGATYTITALTAPKPKPVEKGRLQGEVQIQDSSYGAMIPILLGANPDVGRSAPPAAADYDSAISGKRPLFYGKAEESSAGNTYPTTPGGFTDFSGNGNHAWYVSGFGLTQHIAGPLETETSFGAAGAFGFLPTASGSALDMRGDFTWEAWAKSDDHSSQQTIINRGGDVTQFFLAFNGGISSGSITAAVGNAGFGGGSGTLSWAGPTVLGHWYHIVVTRRSNVIRLYVDGCMVDERDDYTTDPIIFADYNNAPWRFGYITNLFFGPVWWSQGASRIGLYDFALGANEVQQNYNAGKNDPAVCPVPEPGGGMRVAGNVIYLSEIRKVETTTPGSGGKGGQKTPETKSIEYFADIGIMFSEGVMGLGALYGDSDLLVDLNLHTGTGVRDVTVDADPVQLNLNPFDPSDTTIFNIPSQRFGATPAYDENGVLTTSLSGGGNCTMRFYSGTETQPVDPILEADTATGFGVGRTPAFLGRCWMMLENFNVSKYGRIPNFTAVLNNQLYRTAGECFEHLASRVNVDPDDYSVGNLDQFSVRGIPIFNRTAPRQVFELMGELFAFDVVESNGIISAVTRGSSPAFTIPEDDLGVAEDDPNGEDLPTQLTNSLDLAQTEMPKRIDVKFFDPARDGEVNSIGVVRLATEASREDTKEINAVMTVKEARQLAQRLMDTAWTESRESIRVTIPHTYYTLKPGTVVTVDRGDVTHTIRVKELNGFMPGPLEIVGVVTQADAYAQTQIVTGTSAGGTIAGTDTGSTIPEPPIPATTVATFIDRLLRDREIQDGRPGFYVAACSFGNGKFEGANVYADRGAGYGFLINCPEQATMGIVDATPSTIAGASTIDVELYGTQTLGTFTSGEVTGGAGYILIGNLVLQYQDAVQLSTSPNLWRLTTLSNIGAKCTSAQNGSHAAGERFVVLNTALRFIAVDSSEIGVARNYKVPTVGQDLADTGVIAFTITAPNISVTTPADYNVAAASAGELVHTWTPITPTSCQMLDGLYYEIRADSAGSPGALIYSGNANSYRESGLAAGTYTRHFRARTKYADGSYIMDSATVTASSDSVSFAHTLMLMGG